MKAPASKYAKPIKSNGKLHKKEIGEINSVAENPAEIALNQIVASELRV